MSIQNTFVLIHQNEEIVNLFVSTDGRYTSARLSVAEIDINHKQLLVTCPLQPIKSPKLIAVKMNIKCLTINKKQIHDFTSNIS